MEEKKWYEDADVPPYYKRFLEKTSYEDVVDLYAELLNELHEKEDSIPGFYSSAERKELKMCMELCEQRILINALNSRGWEHRFVTRYYKKK